ncbi:SpoIIE family protein phosphatase [Burkholderia sp. BCC1644]|uniref:PP2C family protein-serine/threonine phosphatase n=1 Tax=Burkholderia sp. BCC1644 TaxID=2676293 RepID=UPI00159233FB|nr:SpoIIE family protein phosphatase [Burkholderia sp. BCC1644]
MNSPFVLIVEDSPNYRLLLKRTLGKLGFGIVEAEDGVQALRLLRERHEIALVVSDWEMPELDGPGLCRAIREESLGRYVYIILLTARDGSDALVDGMEAGADDFLTKPVDVNELRVRLRAGQRVIDLEAALAERNRHLDTAYQQIRNDLQAAATVQQSMLPAAELAFDGLDCEWLFIPSAYLSGDMLNVKAIDDEHVIFYDIDVAGHGVPAAMLSVIVNRLLAREAERSDESALRAPSEVVARMNSQLVDELADGAYFTMAYGVVNTRTGEGKLTQAGHTHPLLVDAAGHVTTLGDGGFPVGLIDGCDYETIQFALQPSDRLYLYSDGVTECMDADGEQFGDERLKAFLAAHAGDSLRETLAALKQRLQAWRGAASAVFDDDISILALQKRAERHLPGKEGSC